MRRFSDEAILKFTKNNYLRLAYVHLHKTFQIHGLRIELKKILYNIPLFLFHLF